MIISFIVTINTVKSNVTIAVGSPYSVVVFDHATTGRETKDESFIENLSEQLSETTNLTIFDKLINGCPLDKKIYQDSDGKYAKWSTDLLHNNLVVEIIYNSMQDLIVYDGDYSRVVSYYCISFVIPDTTDFTEIAVYYSFTQNANNDEKNEDYRENTPLILYGNAEELSEFTKTIKDL